MKGGETKMNIHYCYDCKHNVSFPTIPHTVNNGTMMHKLGKAVKDGETRELRKTHAKQAAIWVQCPGVTNDGIYGHSMRDNCYNCAPYWEKYPTCPTDKKMLTQTGYCKVCRKHYDTSNRTVATA